MNKMILYDKSKHDLIRQIVSINKEIKVLDHGSWWKLRFKLNQSKIDYFIVFHSSIISSKNVKWEIKQLKSNDVLFVINDIKQKIDVLYYKGKIVEIDENPEQIINAIKQNEFKYEIKSLFEEEVDIQNEKDFLFKMLETSEELINRRQNTNNFMLSANGIIITLIGVLFGIDIIQKNIILLVVPIIGIIICYSWYSLIKSYGKLNKAKFEVIQLLEQRLKIPIFGAEWKSLSKKTISYKGFTVTERKIPIFFILLYIAIILITICIVFTIKSENKEDIFRWATIYL